MTKEPFNINSVLEEFDRTMIDLDATDIKLFLISSIRQAMEAVKPKEMECFNRNDHYWEGHKYTLDELETKITNFFNMEKEIEKEDFYVCEHHQSTGGYESCCECSDDGPCTEAQLIT